MGIQRLNRKITIDGLSIRGTGSIDFDATTSTVHVIAGGRDVTFIDARQEWVLGAKLGFSGEYDGRRFDIIAAPPGCGGCGR